MMNHYCYILRNVLVNLEEDNVMYGRFVGSSESYKYRHIRLINVMSVQIGVSLLKHNTGDEDGIGILVFKTHLVTIFSV